MPRKKSSRSVVAAAALLILAAASPSQTPLRRPAMDRLPDRFVWAWERAEDLRDLDAGIGVAFLAQTITIAGSEFHTTPRRQPLRVSPATALVAVTRIEVEPAASTTPWPSVDAVSATIAATTALPRVSAVQIDFDAAASERAYYRQLIGRLRDRLPPAVPISITALASWCAGDDWLAGLPIDEAVPMVFRMGPANEPFRRIALARDAAARPCRGAVGASLDEPIDAHIDGRRLYVFNPRPWTSATLFRVRKWSTE